MHNLNVVCQILIVIDRTLPLRLFLKASKQLISCVINISHWKADSGIVAAAVRLSKFEIPCIVVIVYGRGSISFSDWWEVRQLSHGGIGTCLLRKS